MTNSANRTFKVLIIEDEEEMRDLHGDALRELGCEPLMAPFDLEGMKPMVEECDFILSDLSFDENAEYSYDLVFDLASRCNKQIILCSGYSQKEIENEDRKFHYYVAKPVPFQALETAVEACKQNVLEQESSSPPEETEPG